MSVDLERFMFGLHTGHSTRRIIEGPVSARRDSPLAGASVSVRSAQAELYATRG
jgi:hypothetical protein